jgi:hypothetical protein
MENEIFKGTANDKTGTTAPSWILSMVILNIDNKITALNS